MLRQQIGEGADAADGIIGLRMLPSTTFAENE
jgi:hypothetical protein